MPTEPWADFIPRAFSSEVEEELLKDLSDLCSEVVNFGSLIVRRITQMQVVGDEYLVATMLFRHGLELIDSVSILIQHSSIDPCKLQLRGVFETLLYLEWMTKERFEYRGRAYVLHRVHKDVQLIDKLDINTSLGKAFYADIYKDSDAKNVTFEVPLDHYRDIKTRLLNSKSYQPIEDEYQRILRESGSPPKNWYAMFPGMEPPPKNIEQLASKLGRNGWYAFLYRHWSTSTHASDVISGKMGEGASIYQIRFVKDVKAVALYALLMGVKLIRTAGSAFDSRIFDEVNVWYARELKKPVHDIAKNLNIEIT
jgi:hypothetical protein